MPAPDSYKPKNCNFKRIFSAATDKSAKLPNDRFNTIAPGPGNYRVQSDFGVYVSSDTNNNFDSHILAKIASDKKFEMETMRTARSTKKGFTLKSHRTKSQTSLNEYSMREVNTPNIDKKRRAS